MKKPAFFLLLFCTLIINALLYSQSCQFVPPQCNENNSPGILSNADFRVGQITGGNEFSNGCVCEWSDFNGSSLAGVLIGLNSNATLIQGSDMFARLVVQKFNGNYIRKDAIITPVPQSNRIYNNGFLYFCKLLLSGCPTNGTTGFKVYVYNADGSIYEMFTITQSMMQGPNCLFYNDSDKFYTHTYSPEARFIIITPFIPTTSGSSQVDINIAEMDYIENCGYTNPESQCDNDCPSGLLYNGDFEVAANFASPFDGEFNNGCVCGWETHSGIVNIETVSSNNFASMPLTMGRVSHPVSLSSSTAYTITFDFKYDDYNGTGLTSGQDIMFRFASAAGTLYGSFYFDLNSATYNENTWYTDQSFEFTAGQLSSMGIFVGIIDDIVIYPGNSWDLSTGFELSIDNVGFEKTTNLKPTVSIDVATDHCPGSVGFDFIKSFNFPSTLSSCDWDFGDGTLLTISGIDFNDSQNYPVYHTYANKSDNKIDYTVSVTFNYDNCTDYIEKDITIWPQPRLVVNPHTPIQNKDVTFKYTPYETITSWTLTYGDGTQESGNTSHPFTKTHSYSVPGSYSANLEVDYDLGGGSTITCSKTVSLTVCSEEYIPPFAPESNETYVLSVWVKQYFETYIPYPLELTDPAVKLYFDLDDSETATVMGPYYASGNIIDGWQRIYVEFVIPVNALNISVSLINNSSTQFHDCYFDDLRIHPLGANMKSFVYDPISLRFLAELDENNYATFYEYDEEGKLIRTKKETENGIVTLSESRNSIIKN